MPDARKPPTPISLPAIITAARAGALEHAWSLFQSSGYEAQSDNPAALAVKGRLLKDLALRAVSNERQSLLLAAIAAYAAADRLSPQPYTKINIATLRLFAGDQAAAATEARTLLAALDGNASFQETPYYLAATRAEALLLCGDKAAAEAALAIAIGHSPDAWSDHASTLRQFRLILSSQSRDDAWLDAYRPPQSLHYAGHIGVAEPGESTLKAAAGNLLISQHIGFGFGALAAGADIVIAEALLAHGAELHLVLPVTRETFLAQSVAPYGEGWVRRFNVCYEGAHSIRIATSLDGSYEPLATAFAAELAMGAAILNARSLESSAAQLLAVDDGAGRYGDGIWTARDGRRWEATGNSQHIVRVARDANVSASGTKPAEGRPDRRLAALLHIAFEGLDDLDDTAFADALDTVILPFRARAAACPNQPGMTLPVGNGRIAIFETPPAAWAYAHALLDYPALALPLRIAAHYGLAHWLDDPAALTGPTITELSSIAAVAMPATLTASEPFASALFVGSAGPPITELIGALDGRKLFAITDPIQ
jgi:MAP3K TRAFs-binding domain